jgi:hypothetical protein
MTSIASSASEVKVQHRSLLIERGYEEFTGRLKQILGRAILPADAVGADPSRRRIFCVANLCSASVKRKV